MPIVDLGKVVPRLITRVGELTYEVELTKAYAETLEQEIAALKERFGIADDTEEAREALRQSEIAAQAQAEGST